MTVRPNSFDLLRLLAALAVVWGHACELSGHLQADPIVLFSGVGGLGSLGVSVFFAISGFLVTASFTRRPNLAVFAAGRALRIMPALAAVVILTAFVLGPCVTRLPLGAYLANPQTWLYPLRNILILPVDYRLPGVFATNPYPNAVNGSLWTLRLEVGLYAVTALLGWLRWLRPNLVGGLAILISVALLGAVASGRAPLQAVILLRSAVLYMLGAALWLRYGDAGWSDKGVRATAWIVGVATVLGALSRTWGDALFAILLPLPILALGNAGWPGQRLLARIGDLSYGIYLWSFPVQQTLVMLQPGIGVAPLLGETLLIVLPLAWLSWRLIERPALALKPRLHSYLVRFDQKTPAAAPEIEAPDARIAEAAGEVSRR